MSRTAPAGGQRIAPKKGLGQNFLVDPAHRARVVAAAELDPADAVLEVGPGRGELTELIVAQAGRLVAVELDDRLIEPLRARFSLHPGVTIIHGDILQIDPGAMMAAAGAPSYKVIANLPYYITGAAIRRLLETEPPPTLLVLTVQSEVADRIVASPPKMSLLALGVQLYCDARIVSRIPAGAFHPAPKVDSAVVRMQRLPESALLDVASDELFRVARAGFSRPRRQMRNTLSAGLGVSPDQAVAWLSAAGVRPDRRAETLTVAEWGALTREVKAGGGIG